MEPEVATESDAPPCAHNHLTRLVVPGYHDRYVCDQCHHKFSVPTPWAGMQVMTGGPVAP